MFLQLSFYNALPRGTHIGPQQKLDIALATVAVGVLHRQPHLVQHAAAALKQLQRQAAKVCSGLEDPHSCDTVGDLQIGWGL